MMPNFVDLVTTHPTTADVAAVVLLLAFVAHSYRIGPGWLPHDPCPCCCWCVGGRPLGDRLEERAKRLRGVTDDGNGGGS